MLFYADRVRWLDPQATRDGVMETLAGAADLYRQHAASAGRLALESHSRLVGAAIALGELHQAASDLLNPTNDDAFPEIDQLAQAGVLVGRCVYRSARLLKAFASNPDGEAVEGSGDLSNLLEQAATAVHAGASLSLPNPVQARVPEGYAFYSLYPEMYLASLDRALHLRGDGGDRVVVGIRSIGTSLAAVVAGALAERGIRARVETLRPRGHPFDRHISLASALRERLLEDVRMGVGFVLVDEGPGLTCSSFLSVCSALSALGVAEERLTLLSAWRGAPSVFASDESRDRWQRLAVFHTEAADAFDGWRGMVPFVEGALATGANMSCPRTGGEWPEIHDLSYGRWRQRLYPSTRAWPAIHRATERVKLLFEWCAGRADAGTRGHGDAEMDGVGQGLVPCRPAVGEHGDGETRGQGDAERPQRTEPAIQNSELRPQNPEPGSALSTLHPVLSPQSTVHSPQNPELRPQHSTSSTQILAKFAGLGEYGREKYERAAALAAAGFSPPVAGLAYGFLLYRFVAEGRPLNAGDLSSALLSRMVDYYAFIARRFRAADGPSFERLAQMVALNVRTALELDASDFVSFWKSRQAAIDGLPLVLVDGRPQPHEWLVVEGQGERSYLKTDSADHFADHTLVGEQSILWDLAGACEEWGMDDTQIRRLLDLWERATGQREAAGYLDFYRTAYLAFRVAALHYAVHSTDEDDVRQGLQHEEWQYRQRLGALVRSPQWDQGLAPGELGAVAGVTADG